MSETYCLRLQLKYLKPILLDLRLTEVILYNIQLINIDIIVFDCGNVKICDFEPHKSDYIHINSGISCFFEYEPLELIVFKIYLETNEM